MSFRRSTTGAVERRRWKFNVPRAPWRGGFYERLVRTTKDALKRTLYKSLLTFRELETALFRIEAVINARPLMAVCGDLHDARPLSPNDFLLKSTTDSFDVENGVSGTSLTEPGMDGSSLSAWWRHRQQVLAHMWKRWKNKYIRELRALRRQEADEPNVGDLLLIGDNPITSNALWRTGRIAQLYAGRDGLPRPASVQLSDSIEVSRPIQRLYPLELSSR